MRTLAILLGFSSAVASAQTRPYELRSEANLVLVPTEVETSKGATIYGLRSGQFHLEDNGVAQSVRLEEADDAQELSLVVVVQCSRDAYRDFGHLKSLGTMIDDLVGGAQRTVAVVTYGDEPALLGDFTSDSAALIETLSQVKPCRDESNNVTLDAVEYANRLFDTSSVKNTRKAILLVSETRDHGSKAGADDVIADLGRSNTVVESVSYGPAKSQLVFELTDPSRGKVILHGQMDLVPLLRMSGEAVRQNVPHTLARLSGGEYINFTSGKGFDEGMHELANHIHSNYRLSFQPTGTIAPGLHRITVTVPEYPDATIRSRLVYFAGDAPVSP